MEFFEEGEDAMSDYNSQTDWSQENDFNEDLSTDKSNYGEEEAWPDDVYFKSDFEDEPHDEEFEPEPPDDDQDGASNKEEFNHESEIEDNHGEESWSGESKYQFSLDGDPTSELEHGEFNIEEEQNQYMETHHEYKSWSEESNSYNGDETETYDEDTWYDNVSRRDICDNELETSYEGGSKFEEEDDHEYFNNRDESWDCSTDDKVEREPIYISFSGHNQGPHAYLQWEKDLEDWFQSNQIPEENKTSYAEDTLTEDAFRCWEQDAYARLEYDVADASWEEMKQILREEFVEDMSNNRQWNLKIYTNSEPRRWILASRPNLRAMKKNDCCPEPKGVIQNILEKKNVSKKPTEAKEERQDLNQQPVAHKLCVTPMHEPHGKTEQCKSPKISKLNDKICYRCHKRGHYAATCPTRQLVHTLLAKPKIEDSKEVTMSKLDLEVSNVSVIHLSLPKEVDAGLDIQKKLVGQREELALVMNPRPMPKTEFSNSIKTNHTKVSDHLIKFDSNNREDVIMHLNCSKEFEKGLGSSEKQPKLYSPVHTREEENGELKREIRDFGIKATLIPKEGSQTPWRGVIASLLIKEEPPDAQSHLCRNGVSRGKFLNSHLYRDTNLLYLSAGKKVSRTKLFQGRGYDEDIKSSSTMGQGIMRKGEKNKEAKRAKETYDLCSTKMKAKIDHYSSTTTWNLDNTHLENITKKNYPKSCPHEEDIEFTSRVISDYLAVEGDTDQWPLFDTFQLNHEYSDHETTWKTFTAHLENTTKLNQHNRSLDEEDIQFANQVILNLPDLDMHALFGGSRPNQKELGTKPNCSRILTQNRFCENWIHIKSGSDVKVRNFLNRRILDLPYLDRSTFNMFTLGLISLQQLYLCYSHEIGMYSMYLDVPRKHTFMPKLSRLKDDQLAIFGPILFITIQRLVFT